MVMMMTVMLMTAAIFFMVMVMMTMMLIAAAILFMVMMMSVMLMAAATFFMVMMMSVMLMAAATFFMVMVMMMQKFLYLGSMLQCMADSFLPQSLPWRGNNRGVSILIPEHADTFLYLLIRHHLCSADHNRRSVLYLILEELSEVLKI